MDNANKRTNINVFCFNPFQENTYIISSPKKHCWIIDPGCFTHQEEQILTDYISKNDLKPVRLLNTHCHLDHIYGNKFVAEKYGIELAIHEKEMPILEKAALSARLFGAKIPEHLEPRYFLQEGELLKLDDAVFEVLFCPGHSPGGICLYNKAEKYCIVGDVLFEGSIGRTDLPLGNHNTLIQSIQNKLLSLDDEVVIYSGHGNPTTIGRERKFNPFLN